MSSITHLPGYDAWKTATPWDRPRVTAVCRTCGTDHHSDPEYQVCATCQTLTCKACDRHVCDGCGQTFCSECVDQVAENPGPGTSAVPLWLCAECKVEHMQERALMIKCPPAIEISPAEVYGLATVMGLTHYLEGEGRN